MGYYYRRPAGFTIVELLIVIVVIGILAVITVVAYNGIQSRARSASVQADVETITKILLADNVNASTYPASLALANNGRGINTTTGGTTWAYTYYAATNSYCLAGTNGTTSYSTTSLSTTPSAGSCDGLVGWWKFNGDTNDSSGNGNNGTNLGATLAAGQNGLSNSAYSFDGVASQITVNNSASISPTAALSIVAWINPASNAAIIKGIVSKDISGALTNPAYALQLSTSNILSYMTTSATPTTQTISMASAIPTGNWTMLVGTFDGTTMRTYTNGTLYASTLSQTDIGVTNAVLRIGQQKSGSGRWFNGLIDDVRLYNRELPATEVQALYTAGAQ
jgi:prepilin-type N-terminal cleavage/methylation domain-containing protein